LVFIYQGLKFDSNLLNFTSPLNKGFCLIADSGAGGAHGLSASW